MRKLITVMIAVSVLFSAVAFAEDLSALTDAELLVLHQDVLDEMNRRGIPDEPEEDSEMADLTKRVISFFAAWNQNDPDEMLALCDSGWKETVEDPRMTLVGFLAGSIPLDATIESANEIAGESPDGLTWYLVTVTSHLDRNDGLSPELYCIRLLVRKEEDGTWYINPSGLDTREAVEEEESPEAEPEGTAADIVLYYQPTGGQYYHLDRNCRRVNPRYLPLQGCFLYAQLNDEPYRDLKPCEICGAPLRQEDPSLTEETAPVDPSEGSRLVGLLITREDISAYTGEAGVLPASCTQKEPEAEPEYTFGDVSGLRLICFIASEGGEEGSIISEADDGISAVDFDLSEDGSFIKMDATIRLVPGQDEELFFCNPVLRTDSGQVFAVPGDFLAVSAAMNPPGSSVGQTVRDERKHAENGSETTDTTTVSIQFKAVREPLKIRLLQFNAGHELLESEEFDPGTVPEQIIPSAEADYLLLETVEKDPEGGSFTRREAIGRDVDFLNTLSCREDGICLSHYHEVLWETIVPEEDSV